MYFFKTPDKEIKLLSAIPYGDEVYPSKMAIEVDGQHYFIIDTKESNDIKKVLKMWLYDVFLNVPYKPATKLSTLDGMLMNQYFYYNKNVAIVNGKQAKKQFQSIVKSKGKGYSYKPARIETFETYTTEFEKELGARLNILKEEGTTDKVEQLRYKLDFVNKEITTHIDNMSYGRHSTKENAIIADDESMINAHNTYCDWLKNFKNKTEREYTILLSKQLISKESKHVARTFGELFTNIKEAGASIQILKDVEPPIINQKGHYILGSHSKGAITAWVEAHKVKGKMATTTDKEIAIFLNAEIPKLNINERTLRNTGTTAYTKYFKQILALI